MHIIASGPELQAVRFGYVILVKNVKKGRILKRLTSSGLVGPLHDACANVISMRL
jgi:hypothetical protein